MSDTQKFSVSFTLGRPSEAHGANLRHNRREFFARNVNENLSSQNISYVREDVRDAYHKLFGKALDEYNAKQYPYRRIHDYYDHIADGKREEPYYEAIIQFGDSVNAPVGSANGKLVQGFLDEYIRDFEKRNPNLHVFNAVLHLDEAAPHLHIDFIPVYRESRSKGLSTGVSMKAALREQGIEARSPKENQVVMWEESERAEMERILIRHGFAREDKGAKYKHMSVEDYKKHKDEQNMVKTIRQKLNVTPGETSQSNVRKLKEKLLESEKEKENLKEQNRSPYKSFFYSDAMKQDFVVSRLRELEIPFRETGNGFEAQECYAEKIRAIEKEYRSPRAAMSDRLRDDIDRMVLCSDSFEALVQSLESAGYEVKPGKYISVKPKGAERFIRLKSLGEEYSEYALRNRIRGNNNFIAGIDRQIRESQKTEARYVTWTMLRMYTVSFRAGGLPAQKKKDARKPFSFMNDANCDALLALNREVRNGETADSLRESLRQRFGDREREVAEKEDALGRVKSDLKAFYELKEKCEVYFAGKHSPVFTAAQARATLERYPDITAGNYKQTVETLIRNETDSLAQAQKDLDDARQALKEAAAISETCEKVLGGTFVRELADDESESLGSDVIPNGLRGPRQ